MRSRICQDTKVFDTVIIGADKIESDADRAKNAQTGKVDLGIGAGSVIKEAIIDSKGEYRKNSDAQRRGKVLKTIEAIRVAIPVEPPDAQ